MTDQSHKVIIMSPTDLPSVLLRKLRRQKGLSQIDLANKLGVTQAMVSKVESGRRGLSSRVEVALKRIFPELKKHSFAASLPKPGPPPDYLIQVPIVSLPELVRGICTSPYRLFVPKSHLPGRLDHKLVAFCMTNKSCEPEIVAGAYVVVDITARNPNGEKALYVTRSSKVDVAIVKGGRDASIESAIGRVIWVGQPA